jgi:LPPG:FO 2-phospho-L-lactate transferase
MTVVELAGGVGGAKLAEGLAAHLGERLTVVVNTGDDLESYGLAVWPDHDTVAYTLADLDDEERGWGLRGETWTVMERLAALGDDPWFRLGDRDLATHLWRTNLLQTGATPTEVALELRAVLGYAPRILPMADTPVRTEVRTDDGWLEFQDYFVRRRQAPAVHEVRFRDIDAARPTAEVVAALEAADLVVIAPSNPIVSVGPILAVPSMLDLLEGARRRGVAVIAVSGIVGGRALKGPADRMLESLGHGSSAVGVASLYRDVVDALVIDRVDAALAPEIGSLGVRAIVADTIMGDDASRARVAADVIAAGQALRD